MNPASLLSTGSGSELLDISGCAKLADFSISLIVPIFTLFVPKESGCERSILPQPDFKFDCYEIQND